MEEVPYPKAPRRIEAVLIVWLIAFILLYFDFLEGYRTNPVVLFSVPILFSLVFMRGEGFRDIAHSFGMIIVKAEDYLAHIMAILGGSIVGLLFSQVSIVTRIIPLYFPPLSIATTGVTGILALYAVVAVGEEVMSTQFAKIWANWLWLNLIKDTALVNISGYLISRVLWAGLHYFSYGFFRIETIPFYIFAWFLGTIFSVVSIVLGLYFKKLYLITFAISAHFVYDVMIAYFLGA